MEEYRSRKLSGTEWMRVVGNHQTCEYIDLLQAKQSKKTSYPVLIPSDILTSQHFAAPTSSPSASTGIAAMNGVNQVQGAKENLHLLRQQIQNGMDEAESMGKKWWDQANKEWKQSKVISDIKKRVNSNMKGTRPHSWEV